MIDDPEREKSRKHIFSRFWLDEKEYKKNLQLPFYAIADNHQHCTNGSYIDCVQKHYTYYVSKSYWLFNKKQFRDAGFLWFVLCVVLLLWIYLILYTFFFINKLFFIL